MQGAFEPWIDQPIVLRVALGGLKLSLCGKVLKEDTETLLVRPEFGPDVEISKIKILAIEEIGKPSSPNQTSLVRAFSLKREQFPHKAEGWFMR